MGWAFPGAGNWKNNSGTNPMAAQRAKVVLTSAQILALNTTPIQIIPAPNAGYYIDVISCVFYLAYGSVQYTGSNDVSLNYTNGSGAQAITTNFPHATLNGSASAAFKTMGKDNITPVAAAAIVAAVGTANPAAGNSTLTVDVVYRWATQS